MATERKHAILLVDDEPLTLKNLKMIFEKADFDVMTAQDGLEAIAVYEHKKDQIDVILSDIELPEMDGWMMHSSLKEINPQVKVIFTSGYYDPETQARCEREGIQALIPKPFKLDEIVSIVRSHVA
jgi:CheY-like chemotaxis protein